MALRVWLPLTGDLHNQGLSDVEVTNSEAVVNDSGKIGKCYQFGTGVSYLELPASCMTSFTECSVAFWLKILTWQTNYCTFFQAGKNAQGWTDYIFGFLRNNNNPAICFTIGNGSSASNNSYLTSVLELNTWYHIALTYKTGKCSIYINGELDHEYNTTIVPAFNKITRIRLGRSNGNGYQTNCLMNDVRIYDHCLSPFEVKKISQGLVLHYRLSGFGGENLLKNSKAERNHAYNTNGLLSYTFNLSGVLPTGTYTLSFDIKSSNGTDNCYVSYASNTNTINRICELSGISNEWVHYNYTFTNNASNCNNIFFAHYKEHGKPFNQNNTGTVYVKNVKLEKGSIATPWCPASVDTEYSSLGYNIEYDCSGYGNNGTKVGNITWANDTARYTGSYKFNGASRITASPLPAETASVSFWIKPTSSDINLSGSNYTFVFADYQTKLLCGFASSDRMITFAGTGNGGAGSLVVWTNLLNVDEWNHVVILKTGSTTRTTYINGQVAPDGANNYFALNTSELNIACRNYSGYKHYWSGQISDFRAYSTLLSESDILNLYHLGGSIDSSGTFHTYEYVEG